MCNRPFLELEILVVKTLHIGELEIMVVKTLHIINYMIIYKQGVVKTTWIVKKETLLRIIIPRKFATKMTKPRNRRPSSKPPKAVSISREYLYLYYIMVH